jgi:hypothetical protein
VIPAGLLPASAQSVSLVPIPAIWDKSYVNTDGSIGAWRPVVGTDGNGQWVIPHDMSGNPLFTTANPGNVSLSSSNTLQVTFQNAVGASGNGQVLNTIGFKTLLVSVFGATSPAGTITFEGASTDGQFTPYLGSKIGGTNITSVTTASSTSNIPSGAPPQPDLWQFDVSALDQFMCPLSWTAGTVTVKGRLMA